MANVDLAQRLRSGATFSLCLCAWTSAASGEPFAGDPNVAPYEDDVHVDLRVRTESGLGRRQARPTEAIAQVLLKRNHSKSN